MCSEDFFVIINHGRKESIKLLHDKKSAKRRVFFRFYLYFCHVNARFYYFFVSQHYISIMTGAKSKILEKTKAKAIKKKPDSQNSKGTKTSCVKHLPMPFGMPSNYSERTTLLYMGWLGCQLMSAKESIKKHKIAVRFTGSELLYYDCYLPDPDDDNACIHIVVSEKDVITLFRKHPRFIEICQKEGITLLCFKRMPMIDKMFIICKHLEIIGFLQLEDIFEEIPEGIPVEEIELKNHVTDDALKIEAFENRLL